MHIDDAKPVDASFEKQASSTFQCLEETRLGQVLVNAWTRQYRNANEVMEDVKLHALKLGIIVVKDEVRIGEKWEDVFEVRDGELIFRCPNDPK